MLNPRGIVPSSDTPIFALPAGFENVTFCPVLNGWFGK